MKRAGFKVFPGKGGWLRTSIVPISDKQAGTFGLTDGVMLFALVLGVMLVARIFLAH
jgi:hypothetical protein